MDNVDFKMRHLANTVTRKEVDNETKATLDRAEAWVRLVWDADEDLLEKMKNIMRKVELDNQYGVDYSKHDYPE